jgi:hypothetical protein
MSRSATALVALVAFAGFAPAAEAIKIYPTDFKLSTDIKGAEELVKNDDGKVSFYAQGTATAKINVPADGDYIIVVDASCTEAQKEKAKFTLKIGDTVVKENFVLMSEDQKEYKFEVKLKKGESNLSIKFTNDVYKENEYDRNLFVHGVKIEKK